MNFRIIFPLLGAAGVVFACGPLPRFGGEPQALALVGHPGAHGAARSMFARRPHRTHRPGTPDVDGALAVQAPTPAARTGADVRFALAVVNETDRRLEVNFPDGRTRDFAVYDSAGHELWRASRGRLYTQLTQNRMIAAGDSVVYDAEWRAPAPGRYAVVAELRSTNHPVVRRGEFVVPAPASDARVVAVAR